MPSPITSLVTIRYQWVRIAGLDRLLGSLAENRNPSLTNTLVLPATRCNMADSAFAEIVFSSPGLQLEGTIFVPKSEVIAILQTSDPDDLGKVGYKGRALQSLETIVEPLAATPPEPVAVSQPVDAPN